jgi:predicted GIY-YIG superfamily endonuclease
MSVAIGKFKIYDIEDPRDGLPFYVGYTANMEQRSLQHLAGDASNLAKCERIAELQQLNLTPIVREIDTVEGTVSDAMQRESYWIRRLGSADMPLVNRLPQDNAIRVNRGYALREDLIIACKRLAIEQHRNLYEIMEEAFSEYLERNKEE